MISVTEAKQLIQQHSTELAPVQLPLQQAWGLVLAEQVYSTIDLPSFPQSSMDGYAFAFKDWQTQRKLIVNGESAAGSKEAITIGSGQAARIFTGAVMPTGADTVVMQEKVQFNKETGELIISDDKLEAGANVRLQGTEIRKGDVALEAGTILMPAALGYVAGIGIDTVSVHPPPSISIVVTGNELQKPGKPLPFGQVYESNSFSLSAALYQQQIRQIEIHYAIDDPSIVQQTLNKALENTDVVLLTGGVSVGDYDHVMQAATQCGVTKQFHTVKQRPGKPLYFGTRDRKLVFGLPGNPASVLCCFYQYVLPALGILTRRPLALKPIPVPLSAPFTKAAGLTHFLKGVYDGKQVKVSGAQESYRLSSFAGANCLVEVKEDQTRCEAGEAVDIYLLPV